MKHIHATIPAQVFLLILSVFLFSSGARTYEVAGTLVTEHSDPIANHQVALYDDNDVQIAIDQTDSLGRFTLVYQVEPISTEPIRRPDSPGDFKLGSSYPNPFNPRTVIPFEAPERTNAVITVYNVLGQEVMRTRTNLGKGSHDIEVNLGTGLSQGTYLLSVHGDGYSLTRAMTFVSAGISSGRAGIRISSGGQVQRSIFGNSQVAAEPGMYRLVIEGTEVYQQKEVMIPAHEDYSADPIIVFFKEPSEVKDYDGNVYQTVKIGDQWWMVENLRTTRYNNGDVIPTGRDNYQWTFTRDAAYAVYPHESISGLGSEEEVLSAYGALYNWYAVETGNLCPTGWHVPSDEEWTELVNYVVDQGYPNSAGTALKSCRQVGHPDGGDCATNDHPRWKEHGIYYGTEMFGFSALPGGYRDEYGPFEYIGYFGTWWSSTEFSSTSPWTRRMHYNTPYVARFLSSKIYGYSVRCVRNIN